MTPDLEKVRMCHYDLRVDAPAKILRPRESAASDGLMGQGGRPLPYHGAALGALLEEAS
jgi:hypothetical protein